MEKDEAIKSEETQTDVDGSQNGAYPPRKRGVKAALFPPAKKPGAIPRARSHCRKWWWCHLIVFTVGVLVVTLPVVFVAIPNKAQHDVNASTLEIQSQEVTDPTVSSVHMKLVNNAHSDSAFHPTLDAFEAALFLESTAPDIVPFGYITIPRTKVERDVTITVDQVLNIANMDQFIAYNKLVMNSEEYRVGIRGRTGLHQSGLRKMDVDYNKAVTMKGLNKLKGFNITEFQILVDKQPDGSNMNGTIYIPNPSVMSLDLGNVTMDLSVQGTAIGQSTIANLVLKPGDNYLPMRSIVDQAKVIGIITKSFQDGFLPIDIVGNSSISNGQHLPYFEAAIQSNTLHTTLNAGQALAAIGLNITS